MTNSKKHHYISKSILKNFCVAGNSVHYLTRERADAPPRLRNIESIFRRIHYNSYVKSDGSRDDVVERFFAIELDNYIPNWMQTFSNALKTGEIRFDDQFYKHRFVQFFYNHQKRSPDFVEPLVKDVSSDTFSEESFRKLEEKFGPLTEEEKAQFFDNRFQRRLIDNSRVQNFGEQSLDILDTYASMDIVVATPQNKKKSFIVGSNPVVRFEDYPNQPLGENGVEMWTTLTPKIAVGFARTTQNTSCFLIDDRQVRKINSSLTKKSRAIASNSDKLLSSLAKANW